MSWIRAAVKHSGGTGVRARRAMGSTASALATEWRHSWPSVRPYSGSARFSSRRSPEAAAKASAGPMPTRMIASRAVFTGERPAIAAELASRSRRPVSAASNSTRWAASFSDQSGRTTSDARRATVAGSGSRACAAFTRAVASIIVRGRRWGEAILPLDQSAGGCDGLSPARYSA